MAGLFKISDQSATNSRGAYADMLLGYDQEQSVTNGAMEAEADPQVGDSEMSVPDEEASNRVDGALKPQRRYLSLPNGHFSSAQRYTTVFAPCSGSSATQCQ